MKKGAKKRKQSEGTIAKKTKKVRFGDDVGGAFAEKIIEIVGPFLRALGLVSVLHVHPLVRK